jgi:hypothetical protein
VNDNWVAPIGDFTRWKEHDAYHKALERLLPWTWQAERPAAAVHA